MEENGVEVVWQRISGKEGVKEGVLEVAKGSIDGVGANGVVAGD